MILCCSGGSLPLSTVTAYRYRFIGEPESSSSEQSLSGFSMEEYPRPTSFSEGLQRQEAEYAEESHDGEGNGDNQGKCNV